MAKKEVTQETAAPDTPKKKRVLMIISDSGSIGKSTLACAMKQFFDRHSKVTGTPLVATFNLDPGNTKLSDFFALTDEQGQPLPREQQNAVSAVGYIDINSDPEAILSITDLPVPNFLLDFPARSTNIQEGLLGSAAKFVRTFRKDRLTYVTPIKDYKSLESLERLIDMVESAPVKGEIDFVIPFQMSVLETGLEARFNASPKIKTLLAKYPVEIIKIETLFKRDFPEQLWRKNWFELYYGDELDGFNEASMEALLEEYDQKLVPLLEIPSQFELK